MILQLAVLGAVTTERLAELALAGANTRRLKAHGGVERGAGHYPLVVALHAAWLACLWFAAPGRELAWPWLAAFGALQVLRAWVLVTLGRRWTTRIIVVPGERLVAHGPYRYLRHPNYWVVAGEILTLPLAFGLWPIAAVFTLLNAAALWTRVRAEEAALAEFAHAAPLG
jgi:methyltransferase